MDFPDCLADPWGFPMLWVQEVDAFVHLLPVTKAQLDQALVRGRELHENDWSEARRLNRDVPLSALQVDNYWGAFVSGVTPEQALSFAAASGPAFRVPSADEWKKAYRALLRSGFAQVNGTASAASSERARSLLQRLERLTPDLVQNHLDEQPTLADRMFLRLGVMEWVRLAPLCDPPDASSHGALGMPARELWPTLLDPLLDPPVRLPDTRRTHRAFGFRLFRARDEEATWSQR
jgi:hypothetical protein